MQSVREGRNGVDEGEGEDRKWVRRRKGRGQKGKEGLTVDKDGEKRKGKGRVRKGGLKREGV